jgi:hypothetical protein
MPANPPLVASGARDPQKRPRLLPKHVRDLVGRRVYGRPSDPDCKPLDFIEAAKDVGMAPDIARRWLDRSQVRVLLRSERRTFREAVCAGNEGALKRVRDTSENGMAIIGAVRTLEQLNDEVPSRNGSMPTVPGLIIQVINTPAVMPAPRGLMVDVTPQEAPPSRAHDEGEIEAPARDQARSPHSFRPYRAPPDLAPAPKQPWER